jgi:hypothetical protein
VEEQQTTEAETETETKTEEPKKGPRPPPRDLGLWDYFTHHDIGGRAQNYDVRGSSTIDPDKGLVHSGAVGFRQRSESELEDRALAAMVRRDALYVETDVVKQGVERVSRAQRNRDYGTKISVLSAADQEVLRRVYGPQDREPYLREQSEGEVPKGEVAAVRRWNKQRESLGPLRMLLTLTFAARAAFETWVMGRCSPGHSLAVFVADVLTTSGHARQLARAKCEADDLLGDVWGRWVVVRGHREQLPKGWHFNAREGSNG